MKQPLLLGAFILGASTVAGTAAERKGTILGDADLIAFVGATDAHRAKAFYGETLGLRLVREEPGHALVFHAGRTMLRVSLVAEVPPARFTVLGWRVEDIAATVDELVDRGLSFERFEGFAQDERGVWTTPDGTRVAWFRDPDGNMLSLTQFVKEPSGRQ